MQMEQWQDAASRQVELLTRRLDELLARGLELLRSELGVDLGLEPGLVPPWVIPLAACVGLVLMVCLWASVCRGLFKKRPALSPEDDDDDGGVVEVNRSVSKPVKPEEDLYFVPSQVKKSKKKAKQAVKETKAATADGKEPEEGTWETKVSNKEKREQRKKDKGSSDGSASPGGGDRPVSHPPEQPKASAAPAPSNQKKKKGLFHRGYFNLACDVVFLNMEKRKGAAAPVTDTAAVSVPARSVSPKTSPWTTNREPASVWRGDIDDGGSGDPSSDWNAPSEAWGNYEEPALKPAPEPEQSLPEPVKDDDEDEKDKGETSPDGAAKTKKKKKKKKKAAEEGGAADQVRKKHNFCSLGPCDGTSNIVSL
uniref:Metadherin b n=1 Tax=Scophthalmus maximus TaxID=52904 RepID=A0A8D3AE96_SCOMX